MHRRDALKWLVCTLPTASLTVHALQPRALTAADVVAESSAIGSPVRTIELEIDPETQEAAVPSTSAIDPRGQVLAAGCDDHRIRLWNIADGSVLTQLREHTDWVRSVVFHPGGKKLASGGDDHLVLLWNLDTHTVERRWEIPTGVVHCVAFRPDGKLLAVGGFDDQVRLFNIETGAVEKELACPASDIHALAFSPNNQELAAAGRNGVVRIWDLSDYEVVRDVPAHRMRIRAIAYSPDGGQFATAGDDRKMFLWNADGSRSSALPAPAGKVFALVFLGPDTLATGGSDNIIRVLDVQSRRELKQLVGHNGSVAALDFHADSGLLSSAGFDTTVRLWRPGGEQHSAGKVTQRPTVVPPKSTFTK